MGKINLKKLKKRKKSEKRFQMLGKLSIGFALFFLVVLFAMISTKGISTFWQSQIALEIDLTKAQDAKNLNYRALIKTSLRQKFPDTKSLSDINSLYSLVSKIAPLELKQRIDKNPNLLGTKEIFWLTASSKADIFIKHKIATNEKQKIWLEQMLAEKQIRTVFNWKFFRFADSREPEIAGIKAGLIGSFLVMLIFLSLAFPIGIMCAFYLEEFAPKNRLTDIIEISINNLAAIPSIIYGLLGLTLYLQIMNLPRSSSIVGGATLFMLVLPVIIIATRNTIRSIPSAIRDAAIALGASKMQVAIHHLLPLSIPGIMTGTILAVSRALGETAPLLMIGMIAFIADAPTSFFDPTTALPVQIYLWSDSAEMGFVEKTSGAIMVLLAFLILFNSLAIFLRKKFEKRW